MRTAELIAYLDDYLCLRDIPDYRPAYNGLQVEGPGEVRRVAVAVDACLFTIERAASAGADLLLVHHGLFWSETAPVTGAYYRRLAALIKNDVALYACHLPLDAHPEVGNNAVLARMLGLDPDGRFGDYEGAPIGVTARAGMSLADFVARVRCALKVDPFVIATGPEQVKVVGVMTGGAGSWIDQAAAAGVDTFLTGEGGHHTFFEAEERGINLIYAGHYATETVGVQALAAHLQERFGLESLFIDHPTGL
jgi:dinuclear metal center YbgI/SA1388 family protein